MQENGEREGQKELEMVVRTQLMAAVPTQLGSHPSLLPKQEGSAFISPSFKKYNKRNRIQGCFFFLFSLRFFFFFFQLPQLSHLFKAKSCNSRQFIYSAQAVFTAAHRSTGGELSGAGGWGGEKAGGKSIFLGKKKLKGGN